MVEIGSGAKREVQEYWLNEEQALLVAVLSKAPNAPAVRAMLIRVFVAYRRGRLVVADNANVEARLDQFRDQFRAEVRAELRIELTRSRFVGNATVAVLNNTVANDARSLRRRRRSEHRSGDAARHRVALGSGGRRARDAGSTKTAV